MMEEKSLKLYKKIQAPESLKEKIEAYEKENQASNQRRISLRQLRPILGTAACLIFLLGVAGASLTWQPYLGIYVSGVKVGTSPVVVAEQEESGIATARMVNECILPIEVDSGADVTMYVTEGYLSISEEDGEVVSTGSEVIKGKSQSAEWVVGTESAELPAYLTVEYHKYTITYQFEQDETSGQYYITLKEKVRVK